ncbi:hypothetical protein RJ640_012326 [Escallonia rubra]|uniref:ADP-ribosyl cyclase/cyclic ADP-ribose hydrolase n=1 Tax=Escallonia rubra TaxID=112253 RepID=A0AA88RTG6_9ASTE|nr:hypothetical protein RJ640_012326 [Escallonia rubra]
MPFKTYEFIQRRLYKKQTGVNHMKIQNRGKDTQIEFVDYLVHSLKQANIRPFVDRYTKKGISISSQLLTAISESRSSIIVMSEKFAASKWCLIELDVILEKNRTNGHPVMPIFYKVNPSHVRNQEEKFAQALAEHEEKEDKVQVNRWKHALAEFGDLVGWVFPSSCYSNQLEALGRFMMIQEDRFSNQGNRGPETVSDHPRRQIQRPRDWRSWGDFW